MELYQCTLIDKQDQVIRCFIRAAKDKDRLLLNLNLYDWPEGTWIIVNSADLFAQEIMKCEK
jgi:hypothetical protein